MMTNMASSLLAAIKNRGQTILKNDIMICAVFLDPRYRSEIVQHKSIAEPEYAIDKLVLLWKQLNQMEKKKSIIQNDLSSGSIVEINTSHDSLDGLNEYLKRGTPDENIVRNHEQNEEYDIRSLLENFNPEWLSVKESILKYWENSKESHPILYKLATAVFAVPPTEVQIERDFSILDNILTKRRMRLQPDMLEAILLLNLNKDLFYIVKEEELNNLDV